MNLIGSFYCKSSNEYQSDQPVAEDQEQEYEYEDEDYEGKLALTNISPLLYSTILGEEYEEEENSESPKDKVSSTTEVITLSKSEETNDIDEYDEEYEEYEDELTTTSPVTSTVKPETTTLSETTTPKQESEKETSRKDDEEEEYEEEYDDYEDEEDENAKQTITKVCIFFII